MPAAFARCRPPQAGSYPSRNNPKTCARNNLLAFSASPGFDRARLEPSHRFPVTRMGARTAVAAARCTALPAKVSPNSLGISRDFYRAGRSSRSQLDKLLLIVLGENTFKSDASLDDTECRFCS